MRTPIILTIASLACLTITLGFVKGSNIAFDNKGHHDKVEADFKEAWAAGKPDEESRTKLAWLCCETARYNDARKIFAELHASRKADSAYSPEYSSDFDKMAQVEILDTKFEEALRLYQAKLAYDQRFRQAGDARIAADRNNIAVAEAMIAQSKANDKPQSQEALSKADADLHAAAGGAKDVAHDLIVKENALLIAEQRGDIAAIRAARREVEAARSRMKIAVPTQQF